MKKDSIWKFLFYLGQALSVPVILWILYLIYNNVKQLL